MAEEEDDAFLPMTKKKKKNPLPPAPIAGGGGELHLGEEEGEDILAWLPVDEDTVEELMKLLDNDQEAFSTTTTTNNNGNCNVNGDSYMRVKFIENPYSATLVFQSSSSYITINGNEETCGSSFSDWEASVMASVDMRNVAAAPRGGGAWGMLEGAGPRGVVVEEEDGEKGGIGGGEMVDGGVINGRL